MRHPRRWDLPKGHAEPGESLRQTALREACEETGIAAAAIRFDPEFQHTIRYPVRDRHDGDRMFQKSVTYFLGYVDPLTEVRPTEHIAFEWFPWPPEGPIQTQTIDPLLAAAAEYLRG